MITKKFEKFGRKEVFALFLIFWIIPYSVVGYFTESMEVNSLPMWVDNYIPLWTPAILGYALYFPLCLLTFLIIRDENILRKGIKVFIFTALVTDLLFLIYPAYMPKPGLEVANVFDGLVAWVWRVDTNANAFPSQHVAFAVVCALVLSRAFKGKALYFVALATVISVSTMLVKQHYIWDVIGGGLIAIIAYYFVFREKKSVILDSVALDFERDDL